MEERFTAGEVHLPHAEGPPFLEGFLDLPRGHHRDLIGLRPAGDEAVPAGDVAVGARHLDPERVEKAEADLGHPQLHEARDRARARAGRGPAPSAQRASRRDANAFLISRSFLWIASLAGTPRLPASRATPRGSWGSSAPSPPSPQE